MKCMMWSILAFVVRSNQTSSNYVVKRLFENKNSINMQSNSRKNQGLVRFGKNSRQVAKKARSINNFKHTKIFQAKKSGSVFGVVIVEKSASNNDAWLNASNGSFSDGRFAGSCKMVSDLKSRMPRQMFTRCGLPFNHRLYGATPKQAQTRAGLSWLTPAPVRPLWLSMVLGRPRSYACQ